MRLAGQGERGYAMAALLVGLSVMSVLMGALLPVWSQMVTREKEEELIFRGNQYARAIGLFQRKYANAAPPTVDLLVEQRFLRKKYKDPITNEDFQPIYANQAATGISAPTGALRPGQIATSELGTQPRPVAVAGGSVPTGATGGIIGVTSKSKETSIKLYNGRDRYNEWAFIYLQTAQRVGGPGGVGMTPGRGGAGGPGQPGQPGQPGMAPPGMGQPGPFGMPPGSFPGGRGERPGGPGNPFQPGGPQPNRPPVGPGGSSFQPFGGQQQPGTARPPGM